MPVPLYNPQTPPPIQFTPTCHACDQDTILLRCHTCDHSFCFDCLSTWRHTIPLYDTYDEEEFQTQETWTCLYCFIKVLIEQLAGF